MTVQVSSKANEGKVRCNARKYAMGAFDLKTFFLSQRTLLEEFADGGGALPPPNPPRGGLPPLDPLADFKTIVLAV